MTAIRRNRVSLSSVSLVVLTVAYQSGSGSDSGGGGAWTAAVDTVADTITVRTLSGSVWPDTAELVPEMTIGMFEGPDEYILGDVRGMAVTEDGEVYLLDTQVPALRKYDAEGTYVATFGREGGGPGEYDSPDGGLTVLPDGRVVLRDPANGRFDVYSSEGEDVGTWRLSGGFNTSDRLYHDKAGNSYTLVLTETGKPPWEWTYGLLRYSPEGVHTDTVLAPTWDFEPARITGQREGSSSSTTVPFTGAAHWSFSPLGYMVGGVSTDYRLDLYRVNEPALRIEKEWIPVPVASEEADERERRIRDRFQRRFPGWRWNGPRIPDTKPAFTGVFADDDGRIWVQLSTPGRPTISAEEAREEERLSGRPQLRYRETVAFDVFDPDGRFLGHVRTPDEFRASPDPISRGDLVWAVTRDELDVITVVRFRITFPSTT